MKKLAILFVAGALALGACGKKKDAATTPTGGDDMGNPAGGGDAYGADTYGTPAAPEGGEGNPCGGAANPCG